MLDPVPFAQADPATPPVTLTAYSWDVFLLWLQTHGLKLLGILLGMVVLRVVIVHAARRIARLVVRGEGRVRPGAEEGRAETLAGVFRYAATLFVMVVGVTMLLEEVGLPVATLLGGVAVVGLAVTFGAQNLIKDYFTGFMILLEDQYAVGDVVTIGGVSGVVERITLRVTMLRDAAGVAHFVPHGTGAAVSNMTYGWARALLDVRVGYEQNPDRIAEVLRQVCSELRQDATLGQAILEDAQVQSVNDLAESAFVIQVSLKTLPGRRWDVQRELRRRIKLRFDELGVAFPLPGRSVYLHREPATEGE